jgi:outer membrane protein insertion porin family
MVYGPGQDIDFGTLRYSAGIALQWYNILGPLALSYAFPLNDEEGDDLQAFQISLGKMFR